MTLVKSAGEMDEDQFMTHWELRHGDGFRPLWVDDTIQLAHDKDHQHNQSRLDHEHEDSSSR